MRRLSGAEDGADTIFGVYLQRGFCGVFISQREREKKNCSGYCWICLWLIRLLRSRQNPHVVLQINDGWSGLPWAERQGMSWGEPLRCFRWYSSKVDKPTCWVHMRSPLTLYSLHWWQIISFISVYPQLQTGLLGRKQLSPRRRMQLQLDCLCASEGSHSVTEPHTLPVPLQREELPAASLGCAGRSHFAHLTGWREDSSMLSCSWGLRVWW